MHSTKIDIPLEQCERLVRLLNERLADLIDLQRQAKQAHWNVRGPNFIALHRLFDEIAEQLDEQIDDVAERTTALGGVAECTLAIVCKRTHLAPYSLEITSGSDHLDALSTSVAIVGCSMRLALDRVTELADADTADLLTGVSRALDKHLWTLDAHLDCDCSPGIHTKKARDHFEAKCSLSS